MAETFTKAQLREGVKPTSNLTVTTHTFSIENSIGNTYFVIESQNNAFVFNSASISNPINCSFVTGSKNAAFCINAKSTATFNLVVTKEIAKEDIKYTATNPLVYSLGDPTSLGSILGCSLSTAEAGGSPPPGSGDRGSGVDNLLTEESDFIITETSDNIILEENE